MKNSTQADVFSSKKKKNIIWKFFLFLLNMLKLLHV